MCGPMVDTGFGIRDNWDGGKTLRAGGSTRGDVLCSYYLNIRIGDAQFADLFIISSVFHWYKRPGLCHIES